MLDTAVPPNAGTEVILPNADPGRTVVREGNTVIWENGKPTPSLPPEFEDIKATAAGLSVRTGSGRFRFSCTEDSIRPSIPR